MSTQSQEASLAKDHKKASARKRAGAASSDIAQVVKVLPSLQRSPMQTIIDLHKNQGELARLSVPGVASFLIAGHHETAKHVLLTNQDNYLKPEDYETIGFILGKGLLTNRDIKHWREQRKLVQPMFAKRHLDAFSQQMIDSTVKALDELEVAIGPESIDMSETMMHLTLEIVSESFFGAHLAKSEVDAIGNAVTVAVRVALDANKTLAPQLASVVPGLTVRNAMRTRPLNFRRISKVNDDLDRIVGKVIEDARQAGMAEAQPESLLGHLLTARDAETGQKMSDTQIRDEMVTFMLAGHETTANGLTWMWMLLSQHPDVRQKLYAEIDTVLGGRVPTIDDIESLHFTKAVFLEAMRLFPPVWVFARNAVSDDEIDGINIAAGSTVVVSPYLTHRDERVWSNPEGFDPSRFMPDAPKPPFGAYMPFGGGRRICVGAGFAQMEAVIIIAMIAQRFELNLEAPFEVDREFAITLRPRHGMPMLVSRRRLTVCHFAQF